MIAVDRDSSEPPHRQIARQLREAIADGTYPPGTRLPSAATISQEAGVNPLTARKALRLLADSGEAFAVTGMGTYAKRREDRADP